jgi:hypothetical protein
MDQTLQERLSALAEIYKQQKFKLSKAQSDEAASLLAQALLASVGPAHDTVDGFIRALPADSTAKAIGDSWPQQPEATRNHFLRTLPNLPRSDRFDRLKLLTAAAIVDVDPLNGLTFLCTACTSLAPRSGTHFAVETVQVFRKTFLDGQDARIHRLNITAHPSVVTAALLNLLTYCLLNTSPHAPTLPPVFQLPTVKWLLSSQAYNRLKPAHQTQLVETIKKWNTTLQDEVKKTLDLLPSGPSGLPPGFEFLLAPPQQPSTPQPPTEASARPGPLTPQLEKQSLHWKDLLAELKTQLTNLDQDLLAANDQSAKNQEETQTLRTSLANAQTHIQNLREELGKKAEENERNAAGLSTAQGIATEAKRRADTLEATVAELKRNHEQEVKILASRVETEAAQRLDTFKHDLARVLRVDYADFKMASGKPMTPELGEALRDLLAAIFDHLQKQGINTKD